MASHARLADTAVKEAMDVRDAALELAHEITRALENDGEIDAAELARIRESGRKVQREAAEAVDAAERANVGELIAGSYLTGRPLNPNVMRKAAEVGLVSTFPAIETHVLQPA